MKFDFTEEEKMEIGEAMAETDAIKRMNLKCAGADRPDACGQDFKQGIMRLPSGVPGRCTWGFWWGPTLVRLCADGYCVHEPIDCYMTSRGYQGNDCEEFGMYSCHQTINGIAKHKSRDCINEG